MLCINTTASISSCASHLSTNYPLPKRAVLGYGFVVAWWVFGLCIVHGVGGEYSGTLWEGPLRPPRYLCLGSRGGRSKRHIPWKMVCSSRLSCPREATGFSGKSSCILLVQNPGEGCSEGADLPALMHYNMVVGPLFKGYTQLVGQCSLDLIAFE
jgi:hypothetical protein